MPYHFTPQINLFMIYLKICIKSNVYVCSNYLIIISLNNIQTVDCAQCIIFLSKAIIFKFVNIAWHFVFTINIYIDLLYISCP